MPASPIARLRFVTYLAPSIPEELFAAVVRHLGRRLGVATSLVCETRWSGPVRGAPDPFSRGEVDVGFMCSPSYLWLRAETPPAVERLAAAPVFADPRAGGRPVYFSDLVVPRASDAGSLAELRGGVWAYNDSCSLSGYYNLVRELGRVRGGHARFFRRVVHSGSHLASLALVATGAADGAAIDSNALAVALGRDPALGGRIRVVESWGPYPIQPVVAGAHLGAGLRAELAAALVALRDDATARDELAAFGLAGFSPVDEREYERERQTLEACASVDAAELAAPGDRLSGAIGWSM